MQTSARIVTAIPLQELWNSQCPLSGERLKIIGSGEVAAKVSLGSVQFVVADCGLPLQWIGVEKTFDFWKDEVKPRLVDSPRAESGFYPGDFPGEYCCLASEWSGRGNPQQAQEHRSFRSRLS